MTLTSTHCASKICVHYSSHMTIRIMQSKCMCITWLWSLASHPGARELRKQNGFSVSRSDIPGTTNAMDITIKQTINRHAKNQEEEQLGSVETSKRTTGGA
jgi:hypothetical protein